MNKSALAFKKIPILVLFCFISLQLSVLMFLVDDDMTVVLILGVIGGFIVIVMVTIMAYFTVRSEEKQLFFAYLFFSLLQPAYDIWIIYRVSFTWKDDHRSLSYSILDFSKSLFIPRLLGNN